MPVRRLDSSMREISSSTATVLSPPLSSYLTSTDSSDDSPVPSMSSSDTTSPLRHTGSPNLSRAYQNAEFVDGTKLSH